MQNKEDKFLCQLPFRCRRIIDAFAFGIYLSELLQNLQCLSTSIVAQSGHIVFHSPNASQLEVVGQSLLVVFVGCIVSQHEILEIIEEHGKVGKK